MLTKLIVLDGHGDESDVTGASEKCAVPWV
jgi:hypothetical protein